MCRVCLCYYYARRTFRRGHAARRRDTNAITKTRSPGPKQLRRIATTPPAAGSRSLDCWSVEHFHRSAAVLPSSLLPSVPSASSTFDCPSVKVQVRAVQYKFGNTFSINGRGSKPAAKMQTCGMSVIKYILFGFNFVFAVSGGRHCDR